MTRIATITALAWGGPADGQTITADFGSLIPLLIAETPELDDILTPTSTTAPVPCIHAYTIQRLARGDEIIGEAWVRPEDTDALNRIIAGVRLLEAIQPGTIRW